ncbi:AAA domain [Trypanosoma vivax]|nr:putative nonsense mRNA reducing factor 1 [Trypanosoma vivax]KAH8605057.1 AAA domain [Trypanosoma vivax]
MQDHESFSFPQLKDGSVISCARFLLEWVDAAPQTVAGQLHFCLLSLRQPMNQEQGSSSARKDASPAMGEGQDELTLSQCEPIIGRVSGLIERLSERLGLKCNTHGHCQPVVEKAFTHILSDTETATARGARDDSAEAAALASELLTVAHGTMFRAPLVLLLFHPFDVIRIWSCETLMRLAEKAGQTENAASNSEALWFFALQMLFTLAQLSCASLSVRTDDMTVCLADGFCSVFAVLAVLERGLVENESALRQQSAPCVGKEQHVVNDTNEGDCDRHNTPCRTPAITCGVPSAAVLLLGGSLLISWLLSAEGALSHENSEPPHSSNPTVRALTRAIRDRLGTKMPLWSAAVVCETRRAVAKIMLHMIINNGRKAGEAECTTGENFDKIWYRQRLRDLWWIASQIVPSSPTGSTGSRQTGDSAPAKMAGWLLTSWMRNVSAQLKLKSAVQLALKDESNDARGGNPAHQDNGAYRSVEMATRALSYMLLALSDALPQLATTHYYHDFLNSLQDDCVTLITYISLRANDPRTTLNLLQHLIASDLVAFGSWTHKHPQRCLKDAWETFPRLLQRVVTQITGEESSKPAPVSEGTDILTGQQRLLMMLETMDVITSHPSTCVWLLTEQTQTRGDTHNPLVLNVTRCMERTAVVLQSLVHFTQRQHNGETSTWPCNGLVMDPFESPVSRMASTLLLSSNAAFRSVGEALTTLYLGAIDNPTQERLRETAAQRIMQVVLSDEILCEHSLQLDNAKVDSLARSSGVMWANVMSACNWSSIPPWMSNASWWLSALLLDVCILPEAVRSQLLECVIMKLPQISERQKQARGGAAVANATCTSSGNDNNSVTHVVRDKYAVVATPHGEQDSSVVHSDVWEAQDAWFDVEALTRCAQRLLLSLVRKFSSYAASSFTNAVLHVTAVFPQVPTEESFKAKLATLLSAPLQKLLSDWRSMLIDYSPKWFVEILQTVQRDAGKRAAIQNRSMRECEEMEKREVELRKTQSESRQRVVRPAIEETRVGQREQQRVAPSPTPAAKGASGTKRTRDDMASIMVAQEDVGLSARPQPLGQSTQKRTKTCSASTTLCSAGSSGANSLLHRVREQRVQEIIRVENLSKAVESIHRAAGNTDLLERPPRVDDIIGKGDHCLAPEIPTIPLRFDTLMNGGLSLYISSFLPHIALEMRHDLLHRFDDMLDSCRVAVQACSYPFRNQQCTGAPRKAGAAKQTLAGQNASDEGGESVYPLPRWVAENAMGVVCAGSANCNPMDPTRLQFSVTPAVSTPGASTVPSLSLALAEGDVAVLLFPLNPLVTELPAVFGADLPKHDVWMLLGCVPQLCLVSVLPPGQRSATLTVFSGTKPLPASGLGRGNNNCNKSRFTPPSIPFSHILRVFIAGHKTFFMKRISTIGPSVAAVSALYDIQHKYVVNTLLQPHVAARGSRAHISAVERELLKGPRWSALSQGLLLSHCLDACQAQAVTIGLVALVPGWERNTLLQQHKSVPTLPPPPDLTIIEGPPGTGKTQTIAVLTLNLLHHLPKNERRVLLCAPSNCAVDEVLLRVRSLAKHAPQVANVQMLRVGVRENIDPEVLAVQPPLFLDDYVVSVFDGPPPRSRTDAAAGRGSSYNRGSEANRVLGASGLAGLNRNQARDKLLRETNVVCTTLGSIPQLQRAECHFDVVVIDEASQCTEPDVLLALMLAKRRALLVGDSRQLQPTVLCQMAGLQGLRRSLLQRLLQEGNRPFMLRTQFRMHPSICAFPNNYFYEGKLITHPSVLQRVCPAYSALGRSGTIAMSNIPRMIFVDVPNGRMEHSNKNGSRCCSALNRHEASALVFQLRCLRKILNLSLKQFAQHTGILTFYRAQKDAILRLMTREERVSGLQISTTDSFQGKEKDFVFISCVRAPVQGPHSASVVHCGPGDGSLGFLEDWHRINVALTRAKEFCIIFGHRQTFHTAAALSRRKTGMGEKALECPVPHLKASRGSSGILNAPATSSSSSTSLVGDSRCSSPTRGQQKDVIIDDECRTQSDEEGEVMVSSRPATKPDNDPFVLEELLLFAEKNPKGARIFQYRENLDLMMELMGPYSHQQAVSATGILGPSGA